jgi:phage terminase large subunit-like protein
MQIEGWHPLQRDNLSKLALKALDNNVRDHCSRLMDERKWIASPPIEGRVVAVDFPNGVEKFVGPEIIKWASRADLKEISYGNEKKRVIVWKDGSFIEFMTCDQELDAHGGAARDVVWFDEEPPESYWDENLMRIMTKSGRMILGMTSVKGVTWTENRIFIPGEKYEPDNYTITMSSYDNPANTKEMVEKIKAQCHDETEIAIRIFGQRTLRGGNVYKSWKDTYPWVIDPFIIPKTGGIMLTAIDPHPNTPHAVLWIWADTDGQIKEFPLIDNKPNLYECGLLFENATIPELAMMIKAYEEHNEWMNGRHHEISICDPMAWVEDQTKDKIARSLVSQLIDNDITPLKGSKDLIGGIFKVMEFLTIPEGGNHPRLMTMRHLEYLRFERKNYHFPDPRRYDKLGKNVSQKPVDKDDHMMENERRIVEYVIDNKLEPMDIGVHLPQLSVNGQIIDVDWDGLVRERREPEYDPIID